MLHLLVSAKKHISIVKIGKPSNLECQNGDRNSFSNTQLFLQDVFEHEPKKIGESSPAIIKDQPWISTKYGL